MKAPSPVSDEQMAELGIEVTASARSVRDDNQKELEKEAEADIKDHE